MAVQIKNDMNTSAGRPLEGTASLSVDESGIVVAKYEGGAIAAVGGKLKVSFKCQVPELSTGFGYGAKKVDTFGIGTGTGTSDVSITNAQVVCSPGWNSSIGFVTDVSVNGEIGGAS